MRLDWPRQGMGASPTEIQKIAAEFFIIPQVHEYELLPAQEQSADDGDDGDDPYPDVDMYDDCDIPFDVVWGHLSSDGSGVADNFSVGDDGGIDRSGNAEVSDAEDELVVLGRGQRKKIAVRRYQGPIWEEH
ncbi:hypothetical protein C8J57DRAFT_1242191 [Mycena rebaudengoi]|nr:hypothetical protein C8J57DRAFT_1250944 [Mycena rebaudengoi]KAJ7245603.1 hypothetical protein C8J57DRAFT_1242191 [Mycena rebaudengoi]